MAMEETRVFEVDIGNVRQRLQIVVKPAERCLVVSTAPGDRERNRRNLSAPASAPRALLVVCDPWRDVPTNNCFEVSQINAHFHGRRTAKDIYIASSKLAFDLVSKRRSDCRCMLSGDRGTRLREPSL